VQVRDADWRLSDPIENRRDADDRPQRESDAGGRAGETVFEDLRRSEVSTPVTTFFEPRAGRSCCRQGIRWWRSAVRRAAACAVHPGPA
jgi:hypothetical protein